jgi:hypothetical protein
MNSQFYSDPKVVGEEFQRRLQEAERERLVRRVAAAKGTESTPLWLQHWERVIMFVLFSTFRQ